MRKPFLLLCRPSGQPWAARPNGLRGSTLERHAEVRCRTPNTLSKAPPSAVKRFGLSAARTQAEMLAATEDFVLVDVQSCGAGS